MSDGPGGRPGPEKKITGMTQGGQYRPLTMSAIRLHRYQTCADGRDVRGGISFPAAVAIADRFNGGSGCQIASRCSPGRLTSRGSRFRLVDQPAGAPTHSAAPKPPSDPAAPRPPSDQPLDRVEITERLRVAEDERRFVRRHRNPREPVHPRAV